MSLWVSTRCATTYTRTANTNEKGQASCVTPGLSLWKRKTQEASQRGGRTGRLFACESVKLPMAFRSQLPHTHEFIMASRFESPLRLISLVRLLGHLIDAWSRRRFALFAIFFFSVPAPLLRPLSGE